ncbi:MAG: hypothetical protein M1823_001494 [Watsoniomyces obsoletus]|nr:MAG: hypothetical protein M1823_001494 [Watsoniomyces obsoletus]
MAPPSAQQLNLLEITERVSSVLSLLGTTFIIVTFLTSRSFRKPINRIVFYVSFANILTNVATLISRESIRQGVDSPICQAQAFLIQWFMIADPLFTLAMALNVYLTFFRRYSAEQLRTMEWKYLLVGYGLPLAPALTFLFIRSSRGQRAYGPATIWCWISGDFKIFRVATFYAPIWIVMALTMIIYTYTGFVIWHKRHQLRKFSQSASHPGLSMMSTRTTEVRVTREVMTSAISASDESGSIPGGGDHHHHNGHGGVERDGDNPRVTAKKGYKPYSVTIDANGGGRDDNGNENEGGYMKSVVNFQEAGESEEREEEEEGGVGGGYMKSIVNAREAGPVGMSGTNRSGFISGGRRSDGDDVAWSYTRAALSYFVAMVITWVPSSIYRVYGMLHPDKDPYGLTLATSIVLPLQGFWNGIIYIIVSQSACREYFRDVAQSPTWLWLGSMVSLRTKKWRWRWGQWRRLRPGSKNGKEEGGKEEIKGVRFVTTGAGVSGSGKNKSDGKAARQWPGYYYENKQGGNGSGNGMNMNMNGTTNGTGGGHAWGGNVNGHQHVNGHSNGNGYANGMGMGRNTPNQWR